MTTGDVLLVAGIVLCALAFAALAVTLVRVRDTLGELRAEVDDDACRDGAALAELRESTDGAREMIDEAAVGSRSLRPGARIGRGDQRHGDDAGPHDAVGADDQGRRAGDGDVAGRAPVAEGRVMRRAVWFVGGVGDRRRRRRLRQAQGRPSRRDGSPRRTSLVAPLGPSSAPAGASPMRSARAATPPSVRERELIAERDGRLVRLGDHLQPGDELLVDGEPVESGRVILMRRPRSRPSDA